MFSIAPESCRPSSSARFSRSSSPPVSTRTPSNTIAPSARRVPRSGTVASAVASSAVTMISARAARMAVAAGAVASSLLIRTPRTTLGWIRRGAQHQLSRPAVVNPHRGAIRGEQPVGAVAEDVESSGQVQRRRQAGGELLEQFADVTLQIDALAQAHQLECGDEGIARFNRFADVRSCRRRGEADSEQAQPFAGPHQRHQQRGRRPQSRREVRRLTGGVGNQRRRAAVEGAAHASRFLGSRQPRLGAQRVEREARGRLQDAVSRVDLKQQRTRAAGHVQRVLMQMRQQIVRVTRVCQQRQRELAGPPRPPPSAESESGRVARRAGVSRGIQVGGAGPGRVRRFYSDRTGQSNRRNGRAAARLSPQHV